MATTASRCRRLCRAALAAAGLAALAAAAAVPPGPAAAEVRMCAGDPETKSLTVKLPGGHTNVLVVKGDPEARFVLRWKSVCQEGHAYRQVKERIRRFPLAYCFQPGRLAITMRMGCMWAGLESEKGGGVR
jgi:hypothetical protein